MPRRRRIDHLSAVDRTAVGATRPPCAQVGVALRRARRSRSLELAGNPPSLDRPGGERSEAHPPLPRDKRGWQVSPAPDGRGMPEHANPPGRPPHRMRGFWYFVLALIALNWLSVLFFQPTTGEERVTVPFSPYFLTQVKADRSKRSPPRATRSRASSGPSCVTPNDKKATPTKQFATRCRRSGTAPSYRRCCKRASDKRRIDDHERVAARGDPAGLRPHAVIVGLFVLIYKRAAKGPAAWARSAASANRRRGASTRKRSASRSTTLRGSTRPRPNCPRSSTSCATPTATAASAGACPTACCSRAARHGQDAACARGRRRGARGVLLDLRLGVHRGDRGRRRLACARPVRQGQGGGAGDHLHRRARRDRPLAPGAGIGDRRKRRARANPRSDPHRDRRL